MYVLQTRSLNLATGKQKDQLDLKWDKVWFIFQNTFFRNIINKVNDIIKILVIPVLYSNFGTVHLST